MMKRRILIILGLLLSFMGSMQALNVSNAGHLYSVDDGSDDPNKTAIDNMYVLLESTNVYTQEAYDTYKAIADDYLAKWEAGTLTETVVNPCAVQGWRSSNNYDDFLLSAWGTKDFDSDLYINTWSVEGENDGSDFKVPFYEYFAGDNNSLSETTKTATITGLVPNAKYTVSAWIRVRHRNGATDVPRGVTLSVGAEGTPVDVTNGVCVGVCRFYIGKFSAVGEADEDGALTVNFNVASDNNISWLAFKNVRYAEYVEGKSELSASITDALYTVETQKGVGDGLFKIPVSAVDAYLAVIAAAQSVHNNPESTTADCSQAISELKDAKEDFFASRRLPDAEKEYTIMQSTSNLFMSLDNGVVLAEDAAIRFVDAGGGKYYITYGDEYAGYASNNVWDMSSVADNKEAWTITALEDGSYTISGRNGCIGTDILSVGSTCYANKFGTEANSKWRIMLYGEYDPTPPEEPLVPVFKYPLTVVCQPAEAGNVSGKGNYYPGTTATVSTSANVDYTFSHWLLNGERYSATSTWFAYTTVEGPMDFVAVYEYTPEPFEPSDPAEPSLMVKSRLYLASNPTGVCTFNRTSGAYVEADTYVEVSVTNVDPEYVFVGWYEDGVLLTTSQSFNYLPDYSDATLEARFEKLPEEDFDPEAPAEPEHSGDQDDVQTGLDGDANEDGLVDVLDVVIAINIYLSGSADGYNFNLCDVNNDGQVDVLDVVSIINIYLGR